LKNILIINPLQLIKLLSKTYNSNNVKPIQYLNFVSNIKPTDISYNNFKYDNDNLYNMRKTCKEIFNWLNWKSSTKYVNPFTLIILELYEYVEINRLSIKYPSYNFEKKKVI
jgi:hypothetical protein